MTYLQLVNNVLKRLREDTVSSVSDTTYSSMIGDLVNDAKQIVEDAWNWSALRTDLTVSTVASTATYSLTGTGGRETLVDARNLTDSSWMQQQSAKWGREQDMNPLSGSPNTFVVMSADTSGDTTVKLYPTPDDVYSLSFNVFNRSAPFTEDTDETFVPSSPIFLLAWAMAAREKGEVGGQTAAEIFGLARTALSDAVAYDSAKSPTETIFYEV